MASIFLGQHNCSLFATLNLIDLNYPTVKLAGMFIYCMHIQYHCFMSLDYCNTCIILFQMNALAVVGNQAFTVMSVKQLDVMSAVIYGTSTQVD